MDTDSTHPRLRIVPLGGLGEVGMNCLALELERVGERGIERDIVLVDCGTSFSPNEDGVDVVHADFRWLKEREKDVVGLLLTHGHEDHIGAIPYLLRELSCPIWGPAHAHALLRRRLKEMSVEPDVSLHEVEPGTEFAAGPFNVEPVRVSHSIAQATALRIRCAAGTVVHSGDFKFDPEPTDGEPTDEARLEQWGKEGVDLLLSDSTNTDSPGFSGSESEVGDELLSQVKAAKSRVFVALFASNVQRLISLGRVAQGTGRRIVLLGRSLQRHVEVGRQLGLLHWPKDLVLPADAVRTYPKSELLVLVGGTQAEPGASLNRLSQADHRFASIEPGDLVLMSSRVIPGNAIAVSELHSRLLRLGATVETGRSANIHTSGHAYREEQRQLMQLVRPRCFIPVHGTRHHLERHAQLAREEDISQVMVSENGDTVWLSARGLSPAPSVPSGRVLVGYGDHVLSQETMTERAELFRNGVLSLCVVYERKGELLAEIAVESVGVLPEHNAAWSADLRAALTEAWSGLSNSAVQVCRQNVEKFARRWLWQRLRLRPRVLVQATRTKS